MLSDIVGGGALQNRAMSMGGARETIARSVQPAKDVVPDRYPNAPAARTQPPINMAFTELLCMFRVYGHGSDAAVPVCTASRSRLFSQRSVPSAVPLNIDPEAVGCVRAGVRAAVQIGTGLQVHRGLEFGL